MASFVRRRDDGKTVWLHATKNEADRARDARWGDFLNVQNQTPDGWSEIKWGRDTFFIRTENVVNERPLELVFVDVGQGDGCIVVSPETGADERILIVDAGQHDNMMGFVKWRFGKLAERFHFHAAVISHSDQDHYGGFRPLFQNENALFERVYHNGIAERAGNAMLGPTDPNGTHLTGIVETHVQMQALYPENGVNLSKNYGKLMRDALSGGRVEEIVMASTLHGAQENGRCWLPGFAPSSGRSTTIEILGPVPETGTDGAPSLRWFGSRIGSTAKDEGKTKNGHSVLVRLRIGFLRILLGGDLNRPAEDYLLRHYSGIAATTPLANAVALASDRLGADILKCCHHGATDVTDEFLRCVNAFAFVVSSGDAESHAHPRPDLLGRLGKLGRGAAPLILCTELLRSTREQGRSEDFNRLKALDRLIDDPNTSAADREEARKERTELQDAIRRRNVGVYGAINLRTDGQHIEVTFLLEKPRGKQRWQKYSIARQANGEWLPVGED